MKKWIRCIAAFLVLIIIGLLVYGLIRYLDRKELVELALQYLNKRGYCVNLEYFTATVEKEAIGEEDHWKIIFTEIPNKNGEYSQDWRKSMRCIWSLNPKHCFA